MTNCIEQIFKSVTASPPAETIIPRETSTKNRAVRYKKLAHLLKKTFYTQSDYPPRTSYPT